MSNPIAFMSASTAGLRADPPFDNPGPAPLTAAAYPVNVDMSNVSPSRFANAASAPPTIFAIGAIFGLADTGRPGPSMSPATAMVNPSGIGRIAAGGVYTTGAGAAPRPP